MDATLKPYLPTVTELEGMNESEFNLWIFESLKEIPKRQELRDPLFHLKKRISDVLGNHKLTEEQREAYVLHELEKFIRVTKKFPMLRQ